MALFITSPRYVRDDLKQTNTAIVFLLLVSIVYRYSLYFRLRIRKADIIARGLPLAGIYSPQNSNFSATNIYLYLSQVLAISGTT
jgi:hypothetical protein